MRTELPRRPYVELPPPPDGLRTARHEATRRRRRRAVGVAAAGATTAVVAVVAVVVGGGVDGDAVLRPAPVTPATQLPVPSSPPSTVSGVAQHPVAGRGEPTAADTAGSSTPGSGTGAASAPPEQPRAVATPTLTRTRSTYPGAPRVCRTSDSAQNSSVHPGTNWCIEASATAVAGGERLSLSMCRDSTSGGQLTFPDAREADLAVQRDGTTVWSWGHDHPASGSPHVLTAAADECFTWSLVWSGQTQAGAAAAHGAYTLVATTAAQELATDSASQAGFRY